MKDDTLRSKFWSKQAKYTHATWENKINMCSCQKKKKQWRQQGGYPDGYKKLSDIN